MNDAEIEIVARKLAAIKMGLVKDEDGERLPDDLWRQMIPKAKELQRTWDLIPKKYTDGESFAENVRGSDDFSPDDPF